MLKSLLWGGSKITKFKGIESDATDIGESWEISDVEGSESIVANGEYAGKSISEVIKELKGDLMGDKVYASMGNTFPLLIKLIDAQQDLSIQVHPDDKLAKERHNSFGKTEMWYIVSAEAHANIFSGFKKAITPDEYSSLVAENKITDVLASFKPQPRDVFFLPAGRIHSIGAGNFIVEIQQTSNITYRVYDFDRKDSKGNTRELHTELAKNAIDYNLYDDYVSQFAPTPNKEIPLKSCKYFTSTYLEATTKVNMPIKEHDSFRAIIVIAGKAELNWGTDEHYTIAQGETWLIPAGIEKISIAPIEGNTTEIISAYV